MKRQLIGYVATIGFLLAIACGVCMASGDMEKRVEEFKAGIEKNHGVHGEEAAKAADSHEKNLPAAATEGKKESGKHKKAKKSHAESATKNTHATSSGQGGGTVDAENAMKLLMEGNKRYMADRSAGPHRNSKRRAEVAKGQQPFAVIVSCSDSRVPPELLFDQGFGDLFVIRTAGHVVDSVALGSIEYAVDHLGTKLIVVLGHERCGAVSAAVAGGEAPANIKSVVEAIKPAVEKCKGKSSHGHGCDLVCSAVKSNVKLVAEKMRTSPIIAELMEDGLLKVVGAYYDLEDGNVTLTYKPYL